MLQLTQKLKSGQMQVMEVPDPKVIKGQVLIKNYYSLISAGTEASTVKAARKGYLGKAKDRPQQVKQVIDTLKAQGPLQTYRTVMGKLDAYSSLGYSCVGEIIAVAPDVNGFTIGDLAVCGGLTANHAEIVAVPKNLCVNISRMAEGSGQTDPYEIDENIFKSASYNTLGAIAMQGVRQADVKIGETCCVIGLGLLGQLTALILKAAGVNVAGIDIDSDMVKIAGRHCLDAALIREDAGIEEKIIQYTGGIGCDAVIITAAADSHDPINLAGAVSRKKGTVVVVGDVPTGFDREPHYYKKELQVKMSCSYGPGRYDPVYEDKGIDYPPAYARWTENRNMQAFQSLLITKKINLDYLTTHIFDLQDAPKAYDMMLERSEAFIGILIQYDREKKQKEHKITIHPHDQTRGAQTVSIGFIGAGNYAQSYLLPNIPKQPDVVLKGVMTKTGAGSRTAAERFGFSFCTCDEKEIFEDTDINTVFIATRHDSHAEYVIKALNSNKHVFVEKPFCIKEDELESLKECCLSERKQQLVLMIGYNRRFSPLVQDVKPVFGEGIMAINCRINAGRISSESWIHDPDIGGGRIIGEVCHFVDLLTFLTGSLPESVYASAASGPESLNDILNISLKYQNGSIGNISYFANGDKRLPKERIEIFSGGSSAVIDDFKSLVIYTDGKKKEKKQLGQNKGQKEEITIFINAVKNGKASPIPVEAIFNTSRTCFCIQESLRTGQSVAI